MPIFYYNINYKQESSQFFLAGATELCKKEDRGIGLGKQRL